MHLSLEDLIAVRDGEVRADSALHVSSCPECAAELNRLRSLRVALAALPDELPPRDLWPVVRAGAMAERRRRAWIRVARVAAGLAAAFTVAIGVRGAIEAFAEAKLARQAQALVAESQRLEHELHASERQGRVMTGRTAGAVIQLEDRIAYLDARLSRAEGEHFRLDGGHRALAGAGASPGCAGERRDHGDDVRRPLEEGRGPMIMKPSLYLGTAIAFIVAALPLAAQTATPPVGQNQTEQKGQNAESQMRKAEEQMRKAEQQMREAEQAMRDAARKIEESAGRVRERIDRKVILFGDHARLGVVLRHEQNPATDPVGAVIDALTPGSPAEEAGLQAGDIITKFDGTSLTAGPVDADEDESAPTARMMELAKSLVDGQKVTIEYRRGGATNTVVVTARRTVGPRVRVITGLPGDVPLVPDIEIPGDAGHRRRCDGRPQLARPRTRGAQPGSRRVLRHRRRTPGGPHPQGRGAEAQGRRRDPQDR